MNLGGTAMNQPKDPLLNANIFKTVLCTGRGFRIIRVYQQYARIIIKEGAYW